MNLIIDRGNTLTKTAIFDKNGKIIFSAKGEVNLSIIEKYDIKNCIVCNVSKKEINIEKDLFSHYILFSHQTKIPIINKYQTPKSLGLDRLALAVAANQTFPTNNCLVIDAGTCITYDVITKQKEYLGGAISPGVNMRFTALNKQTAHLPLLKHNETEFPPLIGQNTNESIFSGVINGILMEMNGFINNFEDEFSDLKVILTGGDSQLFEMELKNHIFADQNLLFKGLNKILNHNIEINHK